MQENEQLNPEELQTPKLATLPVDPTALEQEEKIMKDVENMSPEELEGLKDQLQELSDNLDADDLNKRNYIKVSPTFYIQPVKNEDEDDETEMFKILNPEDNTVETRELTEDEQKELLISELKRSRQRFDPLSHPTKVIGYTVVEKQRGSKTIEVKEKTREYQTNVTINKFDNAYKAKRKRRNKLAKASRKANR